jgi:hypothetical protein
LAKLRQEYFVVSDFCHFFKRRLDRDIVDMGDSAWRVARGRSFDEQFPRTFDNYMSSLRDEPPDIVILGFTSFPPLRELARSGYRCVACGVEFYSYEANQFSIYGRNDLSIEELRARFATFTKGG